ncbi:acetylcholinesterase-like [Patiria miniata]|uniref:Carboxylic ester hydrolase n=1 Tax=Patiria miniata TaxID=46514 RepID=A0A914BSQ6_PATMI|nr:acetylcholinesterase-like [Patiria miniata]
MFVVRLTVLLVAVTAVRARPRLQLNEGWIVGETVQFTDPDFLNVSAEVDIYKSIPYAEPPIGLNRFRPPIRKRAWDGVRQCRRFKPACMQTFPSLSGIDEDCLFVHVYVPHNLSANADVMVFFHGGAYVFGSGSMPEYTGYPLVTVGGVILVTVNYRLGPFGFMTTGNNDLPANVGMLDQVMALEWVRDNIENFGGDPNKVTIFGESAGASSVGLHLLSRRSAGLFRRAIMQSGVPTTTFAYRRDVKEVIQETGHIAASVGCSNRTSSEMVQCMQNVPARELLTTAFKVTISFQPVVDGFFLQDYPETLLMNGDFPTDVDILLGTLADEGSTYALVVDMRAYNSPTPPYMNRTKFLESLPRYLYQADEPAVYQALDAVYSTTDQLEDPHADYLQNFVRITTDQSWIAPADWMAKAHLKAGSTVYMYHMTHHPTVSVMDVFSLGPGWMGAAHAEDLPYVFGNAWAQELFYKTKIPEDREKQLAVDVMTYWTNFAKTGDPNGPSLPTWPKYTMPDQLYKDISLELGNGRGLRQKYCHFWNDYVPRLLTMLGPMEKTTAEYEDETRRWRESDMSAWMAALDTLIT